MKVNPLYFMIPATIGCSYAFMLPVSTPPNSIAFASGHLMVKDMVRKQQKHYIRAHRCCFQSQNKMCVMFTGENRVCDEHPGNSLCVSGHEHMGYSYVQSTHIPWLGKTFKWFFSNRGYTYYSSYEYDRLERWIRRTHIQSRFCIYCRYMTKQKWKSCLTEGFPLWMDQHYHDLTSCSALPSCAFMPLHQFGAGNLKMF